MICLNLLYVLHRYLSSFLIWNPLHMFCIIVFIAPAKEVFVSFVSFVCLLVC